jgi:hypothetical protein
MAIRKTYKQGLSQEFVDEETGEIIRQVLVTERVEGYNDVKLPNKGRLDNGDFIVLFQKSMELIAKLKLSHNEMKLFIYLIGTAGIGNSVTTDLDIISKELSWYKQNTSTALKGLVKRNIVIRHDGYRYGHTPLPMNLKLNFDQLNYNLAYNGKIKEYKKAKINHPPIVFDDISPNQLDIFSVINENENN